MDPDGEPVSLLNEIGEIVADHFSSDITAKIEFAGSHDYMFEYYLPEHAAGAYLRISAAQAHGKVSISQAVDWFIKHLQKEVEKVSIRDWVMNKAHIMILGTPITDYNVIIPIFDRHGGLWQVEFTPRDGKWEFVRVK
ncbi:hypothetical protein LZD49_07290 [Dyadobacter sp. CY261]|uniref:hypothetical protein n=1 Tax=Dyadobacter sp. CY261 TaxID=2907203 RepID=UPI001F3B4A79|nr:hypothetical protein [Dyadobacter sp. CY261]MCF0070270.1 hypothetical protein [Dyadobacter sp. CY261]